MLLLKNGFLEKIETWHVGLSCQYAHFMSFSSKSEHDTVADQATLIYWAGKVIYLSTQFMLFTSLVDSNLQFLPTTGPRILHVIGEVF